MELVCDVKQEFCEEEIIKQDEADVGIKTELDSNYAPSAIKVILLRKIYRKIIVYNL